MQMTCPKCGAVVNENMKFCRKCGAPLQNMFQEQNTDNIDQTQNQPNAQWQSNVYGQQNPQGQSNMYGQSNMQGQYNMYNQPNAQGQSGMYGQPNMQGQPGMYGQSQMQYGRVQKKKKSGLIIGIGAAVAVLAVVVAGAFFAIKFLPGLFKDPKTQFAENVVLVTKNFSDEFTDFGAKPVEAMIHIGMDDAKDSHTTTKVTTIESDAKGDDQNYDLIQTYSYDSGSGDSAYMISVSSEDTSLGSGGIYFNGNEFIYSPINTTSPMVRYELDDSSAKSLSAYQAMDRYTLMLTGKNSDNEIDWDNQLKDFLEGTLKDIDKKEFIKSKEDYTVFGKTQQCDTVSVTVSDEAARDLFKGIAKIITVGISNNVDIDLEEMFKENDANQYLNESFDITVTTYSYKGKPVGVVISYKKDNEVYKINLSGYSDGTEKQTILDVPSEEGKGLYYEDGIYSLGSDKYQVLTKMNLADYALTIDESGTIKGANRNLSGSFTFMAGDNAEKMHLEEDSITGSISQEISGDTGKYVTETQAKEGHFVITTTYDRGKLQSDKINAPEFLPESGIDCGKDLDMLKENLNNKMLSSLDEADPTLADMGNRNTLVRMAYVLSLLVGNN